MSKISKININGTSYDISSKLSSDYTTYNSVSYPVANEDLETSISKLHYDMLNTANTLINKESVSNKTTYLNSSSTDTEYPSAKTVYDKFNSLTGTATIAYVTNSIVTLKAGIQETIGVISNSSDSDITLHKVATTGSPSDITVEYNSESVSLQTALASIKSGIDDATSAGTNYIVSDSVATTPNVATYDSSQGTLVASASTKGSVYLVPNGTDSYVQYITTLSGSTYLWKSLGSTTVDLTGVVKIITINGKQYAVTSGTTLVDIGSVITTITGQTQITNANTDYVHTVSTTTSSSSTGEAVTSLETQVKVGDISNGTTGIATIDNIKNYIDSRVVIRTWSD